MPPCDVTLKVGDAPGPFGVFGEFRSLTLEFSKPIGRKRILAQDLAGDDAADITALVRVVGDKVHFDGRLLRRLGLSDGTPGDLSSPAVVLALD
jgi:hypothetical protein